MQDAGVLSHLCVKVSANAGSGDPVVKTRVNAGAGTQTVTLTHAVTGDFEDITHTDTVSAGQKWNIQAAGVAGASYTPQSISLLFEATTNTASKNGPHCTTTVSTASQTSYGPLGGIISAVDTVEAKHKTRIRRAGTMANLMANVVTNGRAQASTVTCRKNAGNGTLTKAITGSTTGIFEDTAHTDTVAIADDYNFSIITGTSTGNLSIRPLMVSYQTTTNYGMVIGGTSGGRDQSANQTLMYEYGGFDNASATTDDNTVKIKACDTFTLSDLTILVTANTVSAASTLTSRLNAGAGGLTAASIGSNTSGVFSDTTNTESDVATDQINTRLVTGATGTTLTFVELAVWTTQAAAAAATARPRTVGIKLSRYGGMDPGNEMALGVSNQAGISI